MSNLFAIALVTTATLCAVFNAAGVLAADKVLADDATVIVAKPAAGATSDFYVNNRAPLAASPWIKLPIGAIKPHGWLRKQLELEADGMGGRLPEVSQWLKFEGNGWVSPKSAGGWEELPYWLKGYGDLGYVLGDERINKESKRWIEGILATQQADGWFGPEGLRKSLGGMPDVWPHMPVLNALQSYYESSGDRRVLTLMERYFRWQSKAPPKCFGLSWCGKRCGDNIESVYWLYNRTGDAWLLDLAKTIHDHSNNWAQGICDWHNVNIAQGFREPTEFWLQTHDDHFLRGAEKNYQEVMGIYGQFPGGGFAGDENCRRGYCDPRQGFETCGFVEFMHSFEMLTRITGEPIWADRCEEIAVNSLPAAMTPDLKALHYLTGANMVQLDRNNKSPGVQNGGEMLAYSPDGVYRCCQHNHVMGWPYYAEELWLASADDGLCASLYAASEVMAQVGDGTKVKITEETHYPFSNEIKLKLSLPKPTAFPLYLRVPRWSSNPQVTINKRAFPVASQGASYIKVQRTWSDGDEMRLSLPRQLSVRTWAKNQNSVSIDYGPLTFSLKIDERWTTFGKNKQWPSHEVFPTTPFNYGLELDPKNPTASIRLVEPCMYPAQQPFTPEGTPIWLLAKARKIPQWKQDSNGLLNVLHASPVRSDEAVEEITLIPMGAARLRITAFPTIGTGPDAKAW